MVFPQHGYNNFHNKNKSKHPIQPYTWDNWVLMVNSSYKYCYDWNVFKWVPFYWWLILGRFRACELPSHHPYWKVKVRRKDNERLRILVSKYITCLNDDTQIKYLFNRDKTIEDITNDIEKLKREINIK